VAKGTAMPGHMLLWRKEEYVLNIFLLISCDALPSPPVENIAKSSFYIDGIRYFDKGFYYPSLLPLP
jgi:hypothetical protein